MPGGSDPTVGIHNLAYPICYMPTYINKLEIDGDMDRSFPCLSLAQTPPTRRDVHEVGGRAQSALAAD